jgi:hypothetical protein
MTRNTYSQGSANIPIGQRFGAVIAAHWCLAFVLGVNVGLGVEYARSIMIHRLIDTRTIDSLPSFKLRLFFVLFLLLFPHAIVNFGIKTNARKELITLESYQLYRKPPGVWFVKLC